MLERIEQIQGIGLLHDVNGKPFTFHKATLIYADNGRGKSTLASILRSVTTADCASIIGRKTVDGTLQPSATLQFGSGHKVTYSSGAWSESRPELLVFDSDFIEKNVHSGGVVSTGHRKSLLEFALGEQAVTARKLVDQTTVDAKAASEKAQQLTAQLNGYHQGVPLTQFEKLAPIADADAQIEVLQTRITAANNIESITKRPIPALVPEPVFDLDTLFDILGTSLDDVQEDAEKTVRAHVTTFAAADAENWLSQGQNFDDKKNCPYCAQSTEGNDLVKAYRTHFNQAYADLKKKVAQISHGISVRTSPTIIEGFVQGVATANTVATAWEDQIKTSSNSFDQTAAIAILLKLQSLLQSLAEKKLASPIEAVGSPQEKAMAEGLWHQLLQLMRSTNQSIATASAAIDACRGKLATENVQQLQTQTLHLQMSKNRQIPDVINLFSQLAAVRLDVDAAEQKKKDAREKLDSLMQITLAEYEQSINALLKKFGASFAIEKMDANFRGGTPRSEYGLKLRGKSIPLEGGPPSFATALSEGDKRTLAFAFFVASTLTDKNISKRVVIIDDPMCSLDLNRKQHTKAVLKQIYLVAEQLVVMAHDPYFIRDLRDDLAPKDGKSLVAVFQLRHAQGNYSDFDKLDVDRECESPYYRHHRLLVDFVSGGGGDQAHVAKAIRPLLEGYLHRRFPGFVPRDLMFGQIVTFIRDAKAPHPVVFAQSLADELQEINAYAGQFHHDTNPGNADTVQIVQSELKGFAERALNIIHKGTA